MVFEISVPASITEGFVAYGTTSYGYADFDNLYIDTSEAQAHFHYFDRTYLTFNNRL